MLESVVATANVLVSSICPSLLAIMHMFKDQLSSPCSNIQHKSQAGGLHPQRAKLGLMGARAWLIVRAHTPQASVAT